MIGLNLGGLSLSQQAGGDGSVRPVLGGVTPVGLGGPDTKAAQRGVLAII